MARITVEELYHGDKYDVMSTAGAVYVNFEIIEKCLHSCLFWVFMLY